MSYDLSTQEGINNCKKRLNALAKKKATVDIKVIKEDHSEPQRKYFHAMLKIVADDIGYYFDDFKEAIVIHLGYYDEILGEKVRNKTSKMNKETYSELISKFLMWCDTEGYNMQSIEDYFKNESEG